ncbi:MAG: putative nucleotidyltransferase [Saprospiraceae bacterium]|jgi:predicted nucleotidyltransferase
MIQKEMKGEKVKIKKYFYVLRPILSAYWVGKKQVAAPVEFSELMPLIEDKNVRVELEKLLKAKETAKEEALVFKNKILDDFIEKRWRCVRRLCRLCRR